MLVGEVEEGDSRVGVAENLFLPPPSADGVLVTADSMLPREPPPLLQVPYSESAKGR